MHRILLLNGPNLNLLGRREPERYGRLSLDELVAQCQRLCEDLGAGFDHLQSNAEGALIDRIHASADDGTTAIVINAGGLTHTSVALRDALLGVGLPWYEVHISNLHAREAFRQRSLLSDGAAGLIIGCGTPGYLLALRAACGRAAS